METTVDAKPLAGYVEPYGLLCAILQDGTKEWRGELDSDLPDEAVWWQPHEGGHSIGGCILEIATVEVFWLEQYVLGLEPDQEEKKLLMWDEIDVNNWNWAKPHEKPLSWYFDLHDRIRERTLESIKKWPSPESPIEMNGKARTPRWILGHVIQHESYHGGQAVLLSRLWQMR